MANSTAKRYFVAFALSLIEIGLYFSHSNVRRIGYASQFYAGVVCFVLYSSKMVVDQVSDEMYDLGLFKSYHRLCWIARLILALVTMVFAPLCIVIIGVNRHIIGISPNIFTRLCYICFGFTFQLLIISFTMSALAKVLRCLYKLLIKEKGPLIQQTIRSQHNMIRLQAVLGFIYAISISIYGLYYALQPAVVKHVHIPVLNLPKGMNGFRIVQLCDIHLGPTVGKSDLEDVVTSVQKLRPEMIVITGDLVDGIVPDLLEDVEPLRQLEAPYGKYFISGNHEYLTRGVDEWFDHMRSLGFHVLHNENVKIKVPGSRGHFCLAGVDDYDATKFGYEGHGMDLDKALSTCDMNSPIILLAHQPNAAKMALQSKYDVNLVLSGHTHGGQMFPAGFLIYLMNAFYSGLYKYDTHKYVYVSEGAIYWGIPMRIWSRKEISEIILHPA